ncbi:MAG: hypothetical protein RLZZ450_3925 [Pseudomonadota bacterium]|jgi:hypothetical protein
MVKMNVVRLAVLSAITLGGALTLGGADTVHAEDLRAPMMRSEGQPTDLSGRALVHIAQARGGAGHRRETTEQRSSAMERRETPKPAQMKRGPQPKRERGEASRAANGTARSR